MQKLRSFSLCSFLQRILLPPLIVIVFKTHFDFFLGKEGNPSYNWKTYNKIFVDRMTFGFVSTKLTPRFN
jgi:hypothetical protein